MLTYLLFKQDNLNSFIRPTEDTFTFLKQNIDRDEENNNTLLNKRHAHSISNTMKYNIYRSTHSGKISK